MSGGLPEKFGERIAELDTFPGAEARDHAVNDREWCVRIDAGSRRKLVGCGLSVGRRHVTAVLIINVSEGRDRRVRSHVDGRVAAKDNVEGFR